jgi:hypothetical protein
MDEPVGLIIKGGTALFLQGPDPGDVVALSIANRYRIRDFDAMSEYSLQVVTRPLDLSTLSWKYGFFSIGVSRPLKLEPGPFDSELQALVKTMDVGAQKPAPEEQSDLDASERGEAIRPKNDAPNADDLRTR